MTPAQTEHARHALGLPNDRRQSYRNRYICGTGHKAYQNWLEMVGRGEATSSGARRAYGGAELFSLTLLGARIALKAGETLDREDFPATEKLDAG